MQKAKILLIGEPMGLFIAREEVKLEEVNSWDFAVAGAELNVAIGLSRLEHEVTYLTRLGNDVFGKKIKKLLEDNRLDASWNEWDDSLSTGFMLKGKTSSGDPEVAYFRKGSAASAISVDTIKRVDFSKFKGGILHVTGILPAISGTALEATIYSMKAAKEAGMTISFDPNLRPKLWKDTQTMCKELNRLAELADIILPGYKEGEILCGTRDPEKIADFYLSLGVKIVIVKVGAKGAYAANKTERFYSPTFYAKQIVDTVGAGDGFAAGVLSAYAEGLSLQETVKRGNAIGTIQVMSKGDNDGLPTRKELEIFMANTPLDLEVK